MTLHENTENEPELNRQEEYRIRYVLDRAYERFISLSEDEINAIIQSKLDSYCLLIKDLDSATAAGLIVAAVIEQYPILRKHYEKLLHMIYAAAEAEKKKKQTEKEGKSKGMSPDI